MAASKRSPSARASPSEASFTARRTERNATPLPSYSAATLVSKSSSRAGEVSAYVIDRTLPLPESMIFLATTRPVPPTTRMSSKDLVQSSSRSTRREAISF